MRLLYITLALFLYSGLSQAQSIDEELGFIYVKADYLLGTDRYEEAIQEFTKIIAKNPKYKDVLYKRAKAKYAIAAFVGTKKDLLQAIEHVGITPETIELYGKTLKNLDEHDAATITLETASMINGNAGNGRSTRTSKTTKQDKSEGEARSNRSKIEEKLGSILEDLLPDDMKKDRETEDTGSSDEGTTTSGSEGGGHSDSGNGDYRSDEGQNDTSYEKDEADVVQEVEEEEPLDMSVNEIFIDEDVTLEIKNGIGGRKILQQPNILVLSDRSGDVFVDVCVNENGKVVSAEFNKANSTLSTQSLVSLAVRKSKEFWFEKSGRSEVCGAIVFKISGRS